MVLVIGDFHGDLLLDHPMQRWRYRSKESYTHYSTFSCKIPNSGYFSRKTQTQKKPLLEPICIIGRNRAVQGSNNSVLLPFIKSNELPLQLRKSHSLSWAIIIVSITILLSFFLLYPAITYSWCSSQLPINQLSFNETSVNGYIGKE